MSVQGANYHTALKKIKTMTNTNGRLVRWSLQLESYDITVENKAEAGNSNADGLSRQAEDGPSFEKWGDVRIPIQD